MATSYVPIHLLNSNQYGELAHIMSDESVARNIGGRHTWTMDRIMELREFSARDADDDPNGRNYFYWVILVDSRVIGVVGFHPILGDVGKKGDLQIMYAIDRNSRGKGYATRAINSIMTAQKDIVAKTRTIWAIIRADNVSSIAALTRSDMFMRYSMYPSIRIKGRDHNIYRAK